MGYVQKFITLALSTLINSNEQTVSGSQQSKRRKPLPLPPSRQRKNSKANKPKTKKEMNDKLKKIAVIEICKKLIALQNAEINELIESLTLSLITQIGKLNTI